VGVTYLYTSGGFPFGPRMSKIQGREGWMELIDVKGTMERERG
jgi:hypothetical protein